VSLLDAGSTGIRTFPDKTLPLNLKIFSFVFVLII